MSEMQIETREFEDQPYVFVEAEAPIKDGQAIANAMGAAFLETFKFCQSSEITLLSAPMTVYADLPGDIMRFRSGFLVSQADAEKAKGNVQSGIIAAGSALHTVHVGPYHALSETHNNIWDHLKSEGIKPMMPVWEIYIDDPDKVSPEALRTEVYHAIVT